VEGSLALLLRLLDFFLDLLHLLLSSHEVLQAVDGSDIAEGGGLALGERDLLSSSL